MERRAKSPIKRTPVKRPVKNMAKNEISPSDFKKHVMESYSKVSRNEDEKMMSSIMDLIISSGSWGEKSLDSFLEKVVLIMQRELSFREVSIGLKDKSDGKYRNRIVKGHSEEATAALFKVEYSHDDMFDDVKFPAIQFGRKIIELSSVAEHELEEWKTHTYPALIKRPRKSIDTMTEADYFHAYLFGGNQELVGFMEFSKWRNWALPPRRIIKVVELLSTIVGQILWQKEYAPNSR